MNIHILLNTLLLAFHSLCRPHKHVPVQCKYPGMTEVSAFFHEYIKQLLSVNFFRICRGS